MNAEANENTEATETDQTLNNIRADQNLIHALHARKLISSEARDFALQKIVSPREWGIWTFRLLMSLGVTLILAGIIFFFAYNWNDIPPFAKLAMIQAALIVCIIGVIIVRLQGLAGQLLLLAASILVGVFMAVFGQIYQTGADAYTLFLMWAILTLGWTLVARNSVQWIFWLIIVNLAFGLWWSQEMATSIADYRLIYPCLTLLNGGALIIREVVQMNGKHNLASLWTRYLILFAVLYYATIPVAEWILTSNHAKAPQFAGAIVGALALAILFYVYRYILPDIWSHTLTIIAWFIVLVIAMFEHLYPLLSKPWNYLFIGILTLMLLTIATAYLRSTTAYIRRIESHD